MFFLCGSVAPSPTKAFSMMPLWVNDVNKHEVNRGLRITNDKYAMYMGYTLANRTGLFQPELYPIFLGNRPNNTYTEWVKGNDTAGLIDKLSAEGFERRPTIKLGAFLEESLIK